MTTETINGKEATIVHLRLERATKGALLYKEIDPLTQREVIYTDGYLNSLYIRKDKFKDHPNRIKVTIESND